MALSRATKINNFFLIGKYSPNVFKVIEYSTLRENLFDIIYIDHVDVDCNSLTVSLLNK